MRVRSVSISTVAVRAMHLWPRAPGDGRWREARAGHSLIKTIGEGPWLLGPHLHSGQLRAGRPPPSSQVSNTRSARPLKGVTRHNAPLYIYYMRFCVFQCIICMCAALKCSQQPPRPFFSPSTHKISHRCNPFLDQINFFGRPRCS